MSASARQLEIHAVTKGRRRCSGRARPPHTSSCRHNLQPAVAPRRQGPRVPYPSHTGVFGPLPCVQHPRRFESTSWSGLAVRTQSLRDASPCSESSPLSLGLFYGRRPFVCSTINVCAVGSLGPLPLCVAGSLGPLSLFTSRTVDGGL